MKTDMISLRRRHLLIAGAAAAAAPATLLAGQCVATPDEAFAQLAEHELPADHSGARLIVSGRVVGADCRPLAGALVELWGAGEKPGTRAATDADGRFMVASITPERRTIHFRVSHQGQTLVTQRELLRGSAAREDVAQVVLDEANVWRTTVGLTFA